MAYKLSICIPTLNRGDYIGETLESIACQLEAGVEVVIVDGGSADNTESVVGGFQKLLPVIRYVKSAATKNQPSNEGFDRDCNQAVELAYGEYCWLMTDDDLLRPGAIKRILGETQKNYSVIVVNAEIRNKNLTQLLAPKRTALLRDRTYRLSEWDQFAIAVGRHLTFVGGVIIRRSFWLGRDRNKYFGSGFVHVGVIFDEPIKEEILVIADPLVSIRFGNAQWSSRAFEIWMFNWPELVWSFQSLSAQVKQAIYPKEPWRRYKTLLLQRALGMYSIREYQLFLDKRLYSNRERFLAKLVAVTPIGILHFLARIYAYTRVSDESLLLVTLKNSWDGRKVD